MAIGDEVTMRTTDAENRINGNGRVKDSIIKTRIENLRRGRANLILSRLRNKYQKIPRKRLGIPRYTTVYHGIPAKIPPRFLYRKVSMHPKPFFNSATQGDINSAFNADIGHGDNLFGTERFHLSNDYYGENFFGTEFNTDPLKQLGLDFKKRGASPLLM